MHKQLDRRQLLKTGLAGLGLMAAFPYLNAGAFAGEFPEPDGQQRIYRSPLVREVLPGGRIDPISIKVRLNANENPYGPPKSAQQAVIDSVQRSNRYAWQELFDLVEKIAKKEGLPPNHIMMGAGSSALLEKTAMVSFLKGGNIVSADPTYISLINVAKAVGATWKAIPCKSDWSHDLAAMEAAIDHETRLVYICNPNNPTGAITSGDELYDFCSRVSDRVPVFVDEAYMELAVGANTRSMVSLLKENKNVIIARTFSKIVGLAGMRVGYIAALPGFLDSIDNITRGGMDISYTSIFAASASMDDMAFQQMTREKNSAVKLYCGSQLEKLGYRYIPSFTNFLLFPLKMPGKLFLEKMSAQGIGVRAFEIAGKPWGRVSMGTMEEIQQFIVALKTIS